MPAITQTRKEMKAERRPTGWRLTVTVDLSDTGLLSVNGLPLGYAEGVGAGGNRHGWLSVNERLAAQLVELAKLHNQTVPA